MNAARILYRTNQFWQILLRLAPTERELEAVRSVLTPAQLDLFLRLQPGEQFHSLKVYSKLVEAGESNPDLLAAALLHDAGKICYPMKLWERVWIVIGRAVFPRLSHGWSQGSMEGPKRATFWQRPFIISEHHPAWGAQLASQAGASQQVVSLIRRHQECGLLCTHAVQRQGSDLRHIQGGSQGLEDCLLQKLQEADNDS